VKTIDLTDAQAAQALLALGRHVDPRVELGRPFHAAPGDDGAIVVFTDLYHWFVYPDRVYRLDDATARLGELVEYRNGEEVSRRVGERE